MLGASSPRATPPALGKRRSDSAHTSTGSERCSPASSGGGDGGVVPRRAAPAQPTADGDDERAAAAAASSASTTPSTPPPTSQNVPPPPHSPSQAKQVPQQQQQLQSARQRRKCCAFVLNPSSQVYCRWSLIVSCAFLYNFWSLSYRFAFKEIDANSFAVWFALDYSADAIYALDVVINFHTGFLSSGVLERNLDKIAAHYKECTQFYLDCFCLLPLDVLYLSIGYNSILRITRLVKIYKFWMYVDRTERHTNYPNVFRTFTLVHYILVILHWNACILYMLAKNNIIDVALLFSSEWPAQSDLPQRQPPTPPLTTSASTALQPPLQPQLAATHCSDFCQYVRAFYWASLALTTVGHFPKPKTNVEFAYVTLELLFGLFLFAAVLGHVADIVTNVSAARKEFQAKLDAVKTFMRTRRVSDELQSKVVRWFDYLWMSRKSSDEERCVGCLPDRLKAELAIHVHLDTLKRVDIFQNTDAGFLCELVLRLKQVLFSPGDYVCRKDEVGHEMYIVSRGILQVVADDEARTVVATLKAGSYFGEISVLNVGTAGNKRTASVRSVGYSDLFCLNKQDLWDVLKDYPNAEARIRAKAEQRLSKLDLRQPPQAKLSLVTPATAAVGGAGCRASHSPSCASAASTLRKPSSKRRSKRAVLCSPSLLATATASTPTHAALAAAGCDCAAALQLTPLCAAQLCAAGNWPAAAAAAPVCAAFHATAAAVVPPSAQLGLLPVPMPPAAAAARHALHHQCHHHQLVVPVLRSCEAGSAAAEPPQPPPPQQTQRRLPAALRASSSSSAIVAKAATASLAETRIDMRAADRSKTE